MAITLNGTTGITAPDISVTAQSTDIVTTGDITAVDATLSGGVYLGGTGAANKLEDYEEGTWTASIADNDSGGNVSSTTGLDARYKKIGSLVWVNVRFSNISTAGLSSGNDIFVLGLPFNSRTGSGAAYPGTMWMQSNSYSGQIVPRLTGGANWFRFSEIINNNPQDFLTVGEVGNGSGDFEITIWYEA